MRRRWVQLGAPGGGQQGRANQPLCVFHRAARAPPSGRRQPPPHCLLPRRQAGSTAQPPPGCSGQTAGRAAGRSAGAGGAPPARAPPRAPTCGVVGFRDCELVVLGCTHAWQAGCSRAARVAASSGKLAMHGTARWPARRCKPAQRTASAAGTVAASGWGPGWRACWAQTTARSAGVQRQGRATGGLELIRPQQPRTPAACGGAPAASDSPGPADAPATRAPPPRPAAC